jgi:hypothetical protein
MLDFVTAGASLLTGFDFSSAAKTCASRALSKELAVRSACPWPGGDRSPVHLALMTDGAVIWSATVSGANET